MRSPRHACSTCGTTCDRRPTWAGPPLWLHGDLHPSNMLTHDGRLSAVIDFGDITSGDPATDLALAWMMFDAAERDVFREAAGHRRRHLAASRRMGVEPRSRLSHRRRHHLDAGDRPHDAVGRPDRVRLERVSASTSGWDTSRCRDPPAWCRAATTTDPSPRHRADPGRDPPSRRRSRRSRSG